MKQYEAVEIISNAIIEEELVEAIYLKGSIARANEDEFSNIDMYLIVHSNNLERFKNNLFEYLSKFDHIVHFGNYENPNKSICVYRNGICLNIYTHRLDELNYEDDIVIVYDPKGLLVNYQTISDTFDIQEIGKIIDRFLLNSLEFEKAYLRKDLLFAFELTFSLFKDLGILLRTKNDTDNVKLGLKKYNLDFEEKDKYLEVIKKLKISSILECVKMIYVIFDNYIYNVPILLAEHINFDFYAYTKSKIMSIN